MIALIDGDIVIYRQAAYHEQHSLDEVLDGIDAMMHEILAQTASDEFKAFLTDSSNFRKEINPDYKANRKDKPKPRHLKEAREYFSGTWAGEAYPNLEADDLLGISQRKEETVICSIDKDLLQVPGYHFNFVKKEFSSVSDVEGIRHFYKQMLIGDTADNIKGVDKIGPVGAGKLLDHIETEEEMMEIVCDLYADPDRFQTNADCLWVMREHGQQWSDRCI